MSIADPPPGDAAAGSVPLAVEFVDGRTGQAVAGVAWRGIGEEGEPTPGPRPAALGNDERWIRGIEARLPAGWAAPEQRTAEAGTTRLWWRGAEVAVEATEVRSVAPLRPEAAVDLRVGDAKVSRCRWRWLGARDWVDVETDAPASGPGAQVRGVPWFPRAEVEVLAQVVDPKSGATLEGTGRVRLGDQPETGSSWNRR